MKRRHRMPFGAELAGDAVRFRLWAPALAALDVEVTRDGRTERHPMQRGEGGWFERRVAGAGAGTQYAFVVDGRRVPDPASRRNPEDVHGPSVVIDPEAFDWSDAGWRGRRWEEAVVYELHVGAFTAEGTFAAAEQRLDALAALGITAVELMPVADFPGARNWGYDGVLPFAPDASYGTPEDLKRFVDAAHRRGLMVLLDVVYNHFGPEGNYLHLYAPAFFTDRHSTPWGAAINFDGPDSRTVRDFYVHNALYWIEEFHFDGLRLDAVHAILDDSPAHIVAEIARAVRAHAGDRPVHVVLENDRNQARYLGRDAGGRPLLADAQWNDDLHHALHVLLTGETDGYYADYGARPLQQLGRCLAEGFAFQGDASPFRDGAARGEPSTALPPSAFVIYAQTHDQIGNRALGERLAALADADALKQALAIVLLAPSVPMLFMGEEWGATAPFLFFCDFGPELAAAVTRGRREEFARFERFRDPAHQAAIPDPNDAATFAAATLEWAQRAEPAHAQWLAFTTELLARRATHIVPHLGGTAQAGRWQVTEQRLRVDWTLASGARLHLLANFGPAATAALPPGALVHAQRVAAASPGQLRLEAHGLAVTLEPPAA